MLYFVLSPPLLTTYSALPHLVLFSFYFSIFNPLHLLLIFFIFYSLSKKFLVLLQIEHTVFFACRPCKPNVLINYIDSNINYNNSPFLPRNPFYLFQYVFSMFFCECTSKCHWCPIQWTWQNSSFITMIIVNKVTLLC